MHNKTRRARSARKLFSSHWPLTMDKSGAFHLLLVLASVVVCTKENSFTCMSDNNNLIMEDPEMEPEMDPETNSEKPRGYFPRPLAHHPPAKVIQKDRSLFPRPPSHALPPPSKKRKNTKGEGKKGKKKQNLSNWNVSIDHHRLFRLHHSVYSST